MRDNINPKVQFTKVYPVKNPVRAHGTDAGTDFFVPDYSEKFIEQLLIKNVDNNIYFKPNYQEVDGPQGKELQITELTIVIPPGEQVNIPSGVKVNIMDKGTFLQATNKSGVASKFHLDVMANTIDADYQGVIHINLSNNGNVPVTIKSGQKITQFIHKEYIDTQWEFISEDEYNNLEVSDRGNGGFASTGRF